MSAATGFKPTLWTPGDWNAFFGFGTNILVNMLVLTGLLRFVLKMPDAIVFGRILPALGLMMCLSTFYYALLAYRLAQKTGRTDVCALPSGRQRAAHVHRHLRDDAAHHAVDRGPGQRLGSGPRLGVPPELRPDDRRLHRACIRKITPRAALLGTLAGVSITFIAMRPALEMFMTPVIGLTCFAIILVNWFGGFKYPRTFRPACVAIAGRHADRLGIQRLRARTSAA